MKISNQLLDTLSAQAKANPRLRQSYDLRTEATEARVRGIGTLVHNIGLLCHGMHERYQRLTFITPYFVAWTNSRCLRTMRTTYVSSTSFVGKRSLMLTHRGRPFSPDIMYMPIVWWATMYIFFSRKDLLKSHRRSILHSSKVDKRYRPLWQHSMWVSS